MTSAHTENIPQHSDAPWANAVLVLADGAVFFGHGVGAIGSTIGEICFNTGLTGYQEVLTDPSYAGQIITFTFPHIGNIGTTTEDDESLKPVAKGVVLRENITTPSNFRSAQPLNDWLATHNMIGICGIDTRALTRHIRKNGPQNAVICHVQQHSDLDIKALHSQAQAHPSLKGMELAQDVTCKEAYHWNTTQWQLGKGVGKQISPRFKVVAVDYGAKHNILRCLAEIGCDVTVVPADTSAEAILAYNPNGIFLSNGPGDPAATGKYAVPIIKSLIGTGLPIFGICLGHQLLALTLGATTEKLHQGHRGSNHPVKNLETGKVEITSQNHGFVVQKDNLPEGVIATHISLFDQTLEGLKVKDKPIFSVQHHPESSPGPHDSFYLFETFVQLMEQSQLTQEKSVRKNA